MSYSDSIENNLKSLERAEERDPARAAEEQERKERERQQRLAAAPYAERLKTGPFTQALLEAATRLGFSKRTKVHIAWIDTTLRLEAKQLRLELRPGAQGVEAHLYRDGAAIGQEAVNLDGDAAALATRWLSGLD